MALGTGEKFRATFASDADGRILTNATGSGSSTGGAALADATANPTTTGQAAYGFVFNGTTWDRVRAASSAGGNTGSTGVPAAAVHSWDTNFAGYAAALTPRSVGDASSGDRGFAVLAQLFNGLTYDRPRTPNVFKSLATTAITAGTGATIWTPQSGKKFRVMGWAISSSVAGIIILGDNAAGTVIARSPAVAAAGFFQLGAGDMGNGILSAAANNVLKVDGPTGNVAGMVWGTEE